MQVELALRAQFASRNISKMTIFNILAITAAQGTDHLPIWPNRVFNVISCVVVWQLALFISYWRERPTSFSFSDWWRDDKPRFIAGLVITVALVILKATSTTVDDVLKMLGFQISNTSGVAYGFAIATILLGVKPVQKGKNNNK
jgi:hypothetical protein